MADEAFPNSGYSAIAKIGVLVGSAVAAVLGVAVLMATGGRAAAATAPVEAASEAA